MAIYTQEQLEEMNLINLDTYLGCYDNYSDEFYQAMYEAARMDIYSYEYFDENGVGHGYGCWWHGAEDAPEYGGYGEPVGYFDDWESIADFVAQEHPELGDCEC